MARLAGVSTATVSRALRGLPTVSAATRRRVLAAAEQLELRGLAERVPAGRRPDRHGRVVVPRITRWFFGTVVEAVEEYLHQSGYDLLLYNLGGREQVRQRVLRTANLHKRVDAMMLVATPLRPADLTALADAGPARRHHQLRQQGARLAVRTDRRRGGRPDRHPAPARPRPPPDRPHLRRPGRRAGLHHPPRPAPGLPAALRAAGLRPDPSLDIESTFTIDGGNRATAELLARGEPPTAIFAACDEMAMGAMTALRDAGLRVPQDVSVIGIDDHDLAGVLGLSTVAQPAAEQGRLAARMLLDPLGRPDRAGGPPRRRRDGAGADTPVILPTRLVVRDSTAPPRAH